MNNRSILFKFILQIQRAILKKEEIVNLNKKEFFNLNEKIIENILEVLYNNGYILGYKKKNTNIEIYLTKKRNKPVIQELFKVMKQKITTYQLKSYINNNPNSIGFLWTYNGQIITNKEALKKNKGGEFIFYIR